MACTAQYNTCEFQRYSDTYEIREHCTSTPVRYVEYGKEREKIKREKEEKKETVCIRYNSIGLY